MRDCALVRYSTATIASTSSASAGPRGARDEVGFLELVAAAEVDDPVAALAVGPEVLVLAVAVLADDRRRRVEDDLRRAVVPFELDDLRFAEILLEVEDVAQVGAAPLVDRLIRDRRRRRGCGGFRRAGGSGGTAAGWCPGIRRPSRSGTARRTSSRTRSDCSNRSTVLSSRSSKSSALHSLSAFR